MKSLFLIFVTAVFLHGCSTTKPQKTTDEERFIVRKFESDFSVDKSIGTIVDIQTNTSYYTFIIKLDKSETIQNIEVHPFDQNRLDSYIGKRVEYPNFSRLKGFILENAKEMINNKDFNIVAMTIDSFKIID